MKLDQLLGSLTKLKKTGPDRWVACCPAHEDKGPSLAIKANDKTIMLHCFAGCSAEAVLDAVGMTFNDLYPDHQELIKPQKINSSDALRCIAYESMVAAASMGTMRKRGLTKEESERLVMASGRIQAALEMAGVSE